MKMIKSVQKNAQYFQKIWLFLAVLAVANVLDILNVTFATKTAATVKIVKPLHNNAQYSEMSVVPGYFGCFECLGYFECKVCNQNRYSSQNCQIIV